MKWEFAASPEDFEKTYREKFRIPEDVTVGLPNAFHHEKILYINPHAREFADPVKLSRLC
jgi:hypothetical protein